MIRVRPTLLDDLEAIRGVWIRNALSSFEPEETRKWWLSHPFRQEFEGVPIGWVLEDNGQVVGTFSNIHMMYELDGKRLKAGIAGSWGVDIPYRNGPTSLRLAMAFFGQTGVDMCLNGSASKVASRLMLGLKAQPIASEDYDLSYFWIMRRHAFASAALRKKRIPAPGLLAAPVALGLWATDLIYTRHKRRHADVRRLSNFGEAFDVFWATLRKAPGRLRAVRTAAALGWRFGNLLRSRQAAIFGAFQGQELLGYVVLREATREHLELRQFVIADLQALDDSPEVLTDLLIAALDATRHEGMDALEWQGWTPAKRRVASSLHPMTYRYPVWQLFYKAITPELAPVLTQPAIWDFSPFDAF